MKRVLALFFLAFWFWSVVPAGANTVPAITIDCDEVQFSWIDFPSHDVLLTVTVAQGDEQTVASFFTEGARDGEGSVPVVLEAGTASATVTWSLRKPHSVGPVTTDLTCDTTTTTPTTVPPTTTPPTTTPPTTPPPTTSPPVECGPDTLACTGAESTTDALVFGGGLVGLGALLLAAARTKKTTR